MNEKLLKLRFKPFLKTILDLKNYKIGQSSHVTLHPIYADVDILWSHSTISHTGKSALIQHCQLMLVFPQMSFIWSRIQSRSGWQRSPLFSPACGSSSSSLSLGLSHDLDMFLTLTVLKNSGQLFCRRSSLWVCALFAHGYDGFSLFGLGSDALYLSLHHTRWYRCQSVLLLVILTSFTWLRWYLPGLSTVKLLSVL